MAAESGNIKELLSKFCKDGLTRKDFLDRCDTFLTEVKVPAKWKDGSDYRLKQVHETYQYREKVIREFVCKKESENFKVSRSTIKKFFEELERFADSAETNNTFSDLYHKSCKSRAAVSPLFGEDVKLQGVVVRKTDQNAWVLVRKGAELSELIVDLQTYEKGSFSKGLPPLKEGDIVEVTRFQNETETTLEPDVICCYHLCESEIKEFLDYMQRILQENGSTAAVTEIMRCHAAWDYILQLSKDTCYNQTDIAHNVLYIIEEICSSSQMKMLPFTEQIVQQFTKSVFFKSIFPIFVENTAKEGCSSQSFKMVQSILMHVLSVSPASGPRLLPIAKVLAESLLNNSNGQAAIDFLEKLSLTIAIKVPGAHGDLEALPWREFPLLPVNEEIQRDTSGSERKDLPVIKTEGKYESKKEYLDTYFKLLREECHHKITKGISDFLNKGECDSRDVMMYRISLKDLFTQHRENSPTSMSIQLEFTHKLDSQEAIDWGNTNWLRYGNLLCISFDETFNSPVWAMLEKVEYEQSVVWVTLCHEKTNILSEAEFIMKMQEITDKGEKAYMVESQTFYLSFAPVMDILQHKEFLPFEKFLVYPEAGFKKNADYIEKISSEYPPDWGIIFDLPPASSDLPSASSDLPSASSDLPSASSDLPPPSSDLPPPDSSLSAPGNKPSTYSLLTEFERLKCSNIEKKLDDTQLEAVELALENKLTLIQGPPGTGKSFVGVILVRLLLSMQVPKTFGPIMVVTYKNNALDHFLEMLLDLSPEASLVRVGGRSSSDKLKDHLLCEAAREWREPLRTQKAKLTVQLQKKQGQVKEAYYKLKRSSVFSAKMFLETASESQIKELLVTNTERKPVDLAEIEKLIKEKNVAGSSKYRLEGYVKTALEDWLPSQDEFDKFASRLSEKRSTQALSASENSGGKSKPTSSKGKNKVDQEQENPDDMREPSTEEDERLFSTLEYELPVDDVPVTQNTSGDQSTGERKLIRIDKRSVETFRDLLAGKNLCALEQREKIHLVYVLQSLYIEKASAEFLEASKANVEKHQQYELLRNKHDIDLMRRYDVIGLTVTGAAMRANRLAEIKPSVMIVEEAAEILEGQLVAVIPPSVQHLIMIGDHEQLRPLVQSKRLKVHNKLDISMFERLSNCGVPLKRLGFQARMKEELVELLQTLGIYKELKTNYQQVRDNKLPDCVEKSIYFCEHTSSESTSKDYSKRNPYEAMLITDVAKTFCQKGGVDPCKITVLCAYRGQVTEIKERFKSSNVETLNKIQVTTIDSFQGQENDIILISLVRGEKKKIGFLSEKNRLCVALSRARCGLYLFGNQRTLTAARVSPNHWKDIVKYMQEKDCIGRTFPFHPSVKTDENSPSKDVPASVTNINMTFSNVEQVNVAIGDNASVIANPETSSSSGKTATQNIQIRSPLSEETSVQNPMSPTSPSQREETGRVSKYDIEFSKGSDFELAKEVGKPVQETPKKSLDLSDVEELKERPVQESFNPESTTAGTPQTENESLQRVEELSEGTPVQETEDLPSEKPKDGIEEHRDGRDEQPIQETQRPGKGQGTETKRSSQVKGGEEDREEVLEGRPRQESASSNVETEGTREEALPTQETMAAGKGPFEETGKAQGIETEMSQVKEGEEDHEELSERTPLQESASSNVETECTKEEALPTQETMAAGKGPFEETGKVQGGIEPEMSEVKEGEEDHEELSERTPLQESASSNVETECTKEEALPTQETMAAGKGPFEETGKVQGIETEMSQVKEGEEDHEELSERTPLQESASSNVETECTKEEALPTQETMAAGKGPFQETGKAQGTETEMSQVKEGEEDHEELSERTPLQESASSNVETECTKEEALPTQETMAASKGPFQETGKAQGTETEETGHRKEGQKDHVEISEEKPLPESANTNTETECTKEEVLPTQETMAAGKGPFEETGLEVDLKGPPTSPQCLLC